MAFEKTKFVPLSAQANSDAPRWWSYRTDDTQADVNTSGYFDSVSERVNVGDVIYGHVDADGTPAYVLFAVVSNASGVVDVSDGTAITATDTD